MSLMRSGSSSAVTMPDVTMIRYVGAIDQGTTSTRDH